MDVSGTAVTTLFQDSWKSSPMPLIGDRQVGEVSQESWPPRRGRGAVVRENTLIPVQAGVEPLWEGVCGGVMKPFRLSHTP